MPATRQRVVTHFARIKHAILASAEVISKCATHNRIAAKVAWRERVTKQVAAELRGPAFSALTLGEIAPE